MKIQCLSDLHMEFGFHHFRKNVVVGDVVVVAGDVDTGPYPTARALCDLALAEKPIVYVLGNHEYWDGKIETVADEYREALGPIPGVHLLEKQRVVIEGVRFLGTTLWADMAGGKHNAVCEAQVKDFLKIRRGDHTLTAEEMRDLHREAVNWLDAALYEPFEGPTVVVTHHAPSFLSQHPRWAGSPVAGGYCTDLEWLIEAHDIALWVHGHFHDSADYCIGGTRVVCNPYGYETVQRNHNFDVNKVVEV